jgi:hypothetical protein
MIAVAFTLWAQYFDGRHVAFLGCNLGILLCLGTMARFADGEGCHTFGSFSLDLT